MELPVVNHKDYFAKIGDDHKFPINKFGDLADYLIKKKIVKKFLKPYPCSVETLKKAHSEEYINNIKNKTLDEIGVKKIGFPLVDSVIKRSFIATGGTVLASKLAINYGAACNTAGGSHHANYQGGERYKNCITLKEFDKMKKTSFLINTSRGPIVNEDDLIIALSTNEIAGAGLDVFEKEPLPENNKLRFLPNALLTPHIGYVTAENYQIFYSQMIESLEACVNGRPIRVIE